MKKIWKIVLVTVVALVITSGSVAFAYSVNYEFKSFVDYYLFFKEDLKWEHCIENDMFAKYQNDFLSITKIAHNNVDLDSDFNFLTFGVDYETKELYLYSFQSKSRISLTERESKSLIDVDNAFPDKDTQLDNIRVYPNYVYFNTINGQYSLVYSANDSEPTFIYLNSHEEKNIFVKKICENWYHVVKIPD